MAIKDVNSKCWILALFVRDDNERFLLGDGNYEFVEKQLHFVANAIVNDVIEVQGNDGYLLAGQVRRPAVQSFDGYVGDSSTSKSVVEERRRAFFAFFRKDHFYKVIYVYPDGSAIQRRRGFLVDAPEVKELWQIYPKYHVALNFEDINYYYYDENADGDEIYGKSATISLNSAAQTGGLIWVDPGTTITEEGTSFTVDGTLAGGTLSSLQLKGDTEQGGTPTPDSPVEVQTVTGRQVVTISDGGSQNQEYEVNLGSIELYTIGDHQDRIYKSGGSWYLHKEVASYKFTGEEAWNRPDPSTYPNLFQLSGFSSMDLSNYYALNTSDGAYCTYFTQSTWNGSREAESFALYRTSGGSNIRINNNDFTTPASFRAWLTSNEVKIYYILATPTDTQITNEALISQLEAVAGATTYAGQTIFTVNGNGNLAAILSVELQITGGGEVLWEDDGAVWEEGKPSYNIATIDSIDNVYPVVTITGRTVNPILTDVTTGTIFKYEGTITASQVLVIDMLNKTATLNGVSVIGNVTGDWLYLAPGGNRITYTADNADAPNATLEWQEIVG